MIAAAIPVLEHVTRTAPLGVRFWDIAAPGPIAEGLAVSAWSQARPDRVRALSPSASGVHLLHNAPQLSAVAWGNGTDAFWASLGPRKPFTVAVDDPAGRFLPARLPAQLPHRGFFTPACLESPPGPLGAIVEAATPAGFTPLFSAPSRPGGGGRAVIRAALRRAADERPASWAVVTAEAQGHRAGVGVADGRGELTMLFPFPELERRPFVASPVAAPGGTGAPATLSATVTLRVFHRDDLAEAGEAVPQFCTLMDQPERSLLGVRAPPVPLGDVQLSLGQDSWLTTANAQALYLG